MLVTRTVDRITAPGLPERQAIHAGPVSMDAFHAAFERIEALHAVEVQPSPVPGTAKDALRVAFWNAERLKYLEPSVALLDDIGADVLLLCEVDQGMARSGNRHTLAEAAARLEAGHLFAVEFIELDLGDARERRWHADETNGEGMHGAGIVSRQPLLRPALIRLETSGRWFDGAFGERRVGGRIAVMAEALVAGRPVLLVSVHYESHTDPADRLVQTRVMLDAIDEHAPGRPVLIGGDFNTSTFDLPRKERVEIQKAALAADPDRLVDPVRYEPMFELLADRGYDWSPCNVLKAPTQRTRPDGTPPPPFGKIDWLFARGLVCSDPEVIPAVNEDGVAISDHEALAVTIRPA